MGRGTQCRAVPNAYLATTHLDRRPRESGDPVAFVQRRWIPAFAGMTSVSLRFRANDVSLAALPQPLPMRARSRRPYRD